MYRGRAKIDCKKKFTIDGNKNYVYKNSVYIVCLFFLQSLKYYIESKYIKHIFLIFKIYLIILFIVVKLFYIENKNANRVWNQFAATLHFSTD
jgi:hypothetical protein